MMDQPQVAVGPAPLIVTAELPAPLQAWADGLRREHFPPERNHLSAHVTLFHALPAFTEAEARDLLRALAGATAPPMARLSAIMDMGGGTAFRIECPDLLDLRARVADHFHGLLTGQDGHVPRLHVTIQNKVVRAEARALQDSLAMDFAPRDFRFAGLALHRYLGGPWEPVGRWAFRGRAR
jgi:hypothetical protein